MKSTPTPRSAQIKNLQLSDQFVPFLDENLNFSLKGPFSPTFSQLAAPKSANFAPFSAQNRPQTGFRRFCRASSDCIFLFSGQPSKFGGKSNKQPKVVCVHAK
jgi:hypothetical protein